jgi:multiple sugar transport system ATP-binding protein
MAFGLKLRKTPKKEIDRRVHEAAQILGIENLLDRKPKQLSGGQRQRVAVGRAIVREPNVFLMDEPLSNLDAKLRVQARAEISKLHQRLGTTFIYVTHDQVEAMTMGTRIAVLKDGILQQIDTPQALYDTPSNVFVAGFIGSPAMNFMEATLVERDGKVALDCKDFVLDVPEDKVGTFRQQLGKDVIFGIRPEDTHDPEYAPPGIKSAMVNAKVDVTELMGNEVIVYLVTDRNTVLGRFDPRTGARVGNAVQVAFNMDRMHVFDKQTELAIR